MRRARCRAESGQMTIEFVVALPVMLVVAVVAVNACTFFGICAGFDNDFRDAVRIRATSPAYGQDLAQSSTLIEEDLARACRAANVRARVEARAVSQGHTTFTGTVKYEPTLFGLGLRSEVLGVSMPALLHREEITIDCYKPGVLL